MSNSRAFAHRSRGVFLLCALSIPNTVHAQSEEQLARVAALACQANLDSFPFYKCRFTITKAQADSVAKALKGEYENVRQYDHIIVVDGENEKVQTFGTPEKPKPPDPKQFKNGVAAIPIDWVFFGFVSNKGDTVDFAPGLSSAKLRDRESPYQKKDLVPLSMGFMGYRREKSPASMFHKCDEGACKFVRSRQTFLDGKPVTEFVLIPAPGEEQTYWLDPLQGYLPKQFNYQIENGGKSRLGLQVCMLEAKLCSRDRWFPMHTVRMLSPEKSPIQLLDIRVTELDVDNHPAEKDFELTLPAGTQITSDRPGSQSMFRLKQQESLLPRDIPRMFQMLEASVSQPRMDTAVRKPGWSTTTYIWIGIACGVLILGSFVIWRRRIGSNA